jgi:hypothetical protein
MNRRARSGPVAADGRSEVLRRLVKNACLPMTSRGCWCTPLKWTELMVKENHMTARRTTVFVAVALLFAGLVILTANARENSSAVKAIQLTGLKGVKDNAKGILSVENGNLHFVHGKGNADVSAASIQDVVTGGDSRKSVGKTVGVISMGAPYGGGRFLSLFRSKIDTLTVQYQDADGGLHGAIFTMPVGSADVIKKELVAQGAHTTAPIQPTADASPSGPADNKEQK